MKMLLVLVCFLSCFSSPAALPPSTNQASPVSQTLLFVDDDAILYRSGTHRVFHPFQRHAGNPVIKGKQKPWEIALAWTSVYRNPATGLYQLWYQSFAGDRAKDRTRRCVVCYAESKDGIAFDKPNLGLFDFNGDTNNSIVLIANGGKSDRYGAAVVVDPLSIDPSRRYKMAYFDFSMDRGREMPGLCVAFSPDGIHWSKYAAAPLSRAAYGEYGEPVPFQDEPGREWAVPLSMSDALDAFYDPVRQVFAIYGKMWFDAPDGGMFWKHGIGRIESRDFVHWSRPQTVLTPADDDPPHLEFHTGPAFFYEGCYFNLLQILNRGENGGAIDIELGISRDGLAWQRPFKKQFALPRGRAGQFDSGSIFTSATPIVLPGEIRFYYGAYSGGATGADDYSHLSGIGFATLPKDRFAGLKPVARSDQATLPKPLENIGQITLKPIPIRPRTVIRLNADATEGSIRVELLNEHGYRLRGFSREDAFPIVGNSLNHTVKWKDRSLNDLPEGHYLIRIHLNNAEAFAINLGTN